MEKIFEVRETDRDVSFLRRFLTRELMQDMHLFEHVHKDGKRVVSKLSDDAHWTEVRDTLLKNTGIAAIPVIRITDADYKRSRMLFLEHEHDGRDLQQDYMERTLEHLFHLWGRPVILATLQQGKALRFSYGENGFEKLAPEL
jgi:stage V sporulation protein R